MGQVGHIALRPALSTDRAAIRTLIAHESASTSNQEALAYFLRLAFDGTSNESRAIVAEGNGAVVGFVLFGDVAGAIGTGRLHTINVASTARRNSIGRGLCDAAIADMIAHGARLVLVEVPDDPSSMPGRALLARCGFVEAARVADYYRDGVDLVVLDRLAQPAP